MAKQLEQLKAARGRISLDWQRTNEEVEELERELMPYFSLRKAIRAQLEEIGWPPEGDPQARAALFAELDALQFGCDHCDDPDHCPERPSLASNTEECRSRGNLDRKLGCLRKRSEAYQRELAILDREIAATEAAAKKKAQENNQGDLFSDSDVCDGARP